MRILVWCIGVLELFRLMPAQVHQVSAWSWVWVAAVALWVFAGAVMLTLRVMRVAGKVGGGVKLPSFQAGKGVTPPPHKGE